MAPASYATPDQGAEESLTQTPSPGNSHSDKENRQATATRLGDTSKKGLRRPSLAQTSASGRMPPNKRPRLGDRSTNVQGDSQRQRQPPGRKYYDPHQNEAERRELRKGLRELSRELHGKAGPLDICVWHSYNQGQTPVMSIYKLGMMVSAEPLKRRTITSHRSSRPPTPRLTRDSS